MFTKEQADRVANIIRRMASMAAYDTAAVGVYCDVPFAKDALDSLEKNLARELKDAVNDK